MEIVHSYLQRSVFFFVNSSLYPINFLAYAIFSLELLKLLRFGAGGMRLLPHILDLVPHLLEQVAVVVCQAVDELLVGEQIVAYKLCCELGIDVGFCISLLFYT